MCSYKVVTIRNIESDDPDEEFSLRFGGTSHCTSPLQCFARIASFVLRMMMFKSVNANQKWFLNMGRHSGPRNRQNMLCESFVDPNYGAIVIVPNRSAAVEFYGYYDSLHPHFKIEREFHLCNQVNGGPCKI